MLTSVQFQISNSTSGHKAFVKAAKTQYFLTCWQSHWRKCHTEIHQFRMNGTPLNHRAISSHSSFQPQYAIRRPSSNETSWIGTHVLAGFLTQLATIRCSCKWLDAVECKVLRPDRCLQAKNKWTKTKLNMQIPKIDNSEMVSVVFTTWINEDNDASDNPTSTKLKLMVIRCWRCYRLERHVPTCDWSQWIPIQLSTRWAKTRCLLV